MRGLQECVTILYILILLSQHFYMFASFGPRMRAKCLYLAGHLTSSPHHFSANIPLLREGVCLQKPRPKNPERGLLLEGEENYNSQNAARATSRQHSKGVWLRTRMPPRMLSAFCLAQPLRITVRACVLVGTAPPRTHRASSFSPSLKAASSSR